VSDEYEWRHGWVPLTWSAALQKAHGNHEDAARLLGQARERRRARRGRRAEFVTPHPAHQAEHAARSAWRALTDDDLADAMGTADEAMVERIVAELDRRDAAARKAQRDSARRTARRDAAERARSAEFDAACDGGEDPEAAYARIWGKDAERVRRDAASTSLRASGYRGRGFADLVRAAHRDHAEQTYLDAEDVCRGHLLNKAAQAAGVDPRSLFTGPESRARKHASEELLGYWQERGRMTVEDFTASLLGGAMRSSSTAAWL
jgi:hypothetical protein